MKIYCVERGEYEQTYLDVCFTSRELADAFAGRDGYVCEVTVLEHAPLKMTHYVWEGVLFDDGRLLSPSNALATRGPPFDKYAEPNRLGRSWPSHDYSVPVLRSEVNLWGGNVAPAGTIVIRVNGQDRETVKREFYRIISQIRDVPAPASPS